MKKVIMVLLGVGIVLLIIGNVAMDRYNEGREIKNYTVTLKAEADYKQFKNDFSAHIVNSMKYEEEINISVYSKDEELILEDLKNKKYVEKIEVFKPSFGR